MSAPKYKIVPCIREEGLDEGDIDTFTPTKREWADCFVVYEDGQYMDDYCTDEEAKQAVKDAKE